MFKIRIVLIIYLYLLKEIYSNFINKIRNFHLMEYWLISVPQQKKSQVFETIYDKLVRQNNLCEIYKYSVPQDFKVGTLDVLVSLSDELAKLDIFSESVTRKIVQYMGEILEEQKSRLTDHLKINEDSLENFVTKYVWDAAKFPTRQSLEQIFSNLSDHMSKVENGLKMKTQSYNQLKGSLQTLERKQIGSLLTRNIGELVKKEHFVSDSEYFVTLIVVVAKSYYNLWRAKYETLTKYVVPRSSELICEDNEHGLWNVTLFRSISSDFIAKAKENRFFVRDFTYNENEIQESRNEISRLENDKKKQFQATFRWLKVNFGESFIGLMHIKSLRIFVESVLRYGLPVNFQSIIIHPSKKNHKKIREILGQAFSYLENTAMIQTNENEEFPGLNLLAAGEYYPYVYYKLDTNFVDVLR